MAIPNSIPLEIVSGIPGELAFDGPTRALAALLISVAETNNQFGRALTYADKSVESLQAGGTGTFAGILINPKAYAIAVDYQRNNTQCEALQMGEVYVQLANTGGVVGDAVYFVQATGEIGSGTAGAGQTQIPNCVISRHNVSPQTPTLAVIKLTN